MTQPNQWTNKSTRTYKDNYPLGRKFCSRCKHWRYVVDFNVRRWADEPNCEVALQLSSMCRGCNTAARRDRTGYKSRDWYPHGASGSEKYKKHRRARNRESYARRAKNRQWKNKNNEYKRIWHHAKKAEARRKAEELEELEELGVMMSDV